MIVNWRRERSEISPFCSVRKCLLGSWDWGLLNTVRSANFFCNDYSGYTGLRIRFHGVLCCVLIAFEKC